MQRVVQQQHCGRIPTHRCASAQRIASPAASAGGLCTECEIRDRVVVAFGHEELRSIARQDEPDRRTSLAEFRRRRIAQRGDHGACLRVDHADGVRRRRRGEQTRAVGTQQQRRRMACDCDWRQRRKHTESRHVRLHAFRSPARNEHSAVGADHHAVRIATRGDTLHNFRRRNVYNGERIGEIFGDVQELSVATCCNASGVAGAAALRTGATADDERITKREFVRDPVVAIDDVRVAAGCIQRATIGRKGETDERGRLVERLRHDAGLSVHDLHPLLPPAVEQQQHVRRIGRPHRRQWQRSDVGAGTGGIEAHAGGQARRHLSLRQLGGR